jgi:hypothetical protein
MADTYRSGGKLHALRSLYRRDEETFGRDESEEWDTTLGKGAMDRAGQVVKEGGDTSMDSQYMRTMEKVGSEMGGAGVVLGGEQAPSSAEFAGTGVTSSTEAAGGAGALMGGSGGGMSTGSMMSMIGGQIGSMDDEKDKRNRELLMDDSDLRAIEAARARRDAQTGIDAQELLRRARNYGK